MKKLTTITKIGEAALTRLFKPHTTINAMEQSSCAVLFPREEYDMEAPLEFGSSSYHWGELHFNSGSGYMVWSIELGLKALVVLDGDTALDAIGRLECLAHTNPSHFIVREFSSDDVSGDHETYTVYRLSQKQEKSIQRYSWERVYADDYAVVEPIPSHLAIEEENKYCSEISRDGITVNGYGKTEDEARQTVVRNWCRLTKPALV